MTQLIVTFKIMPDSPAENLEKIEEHAKEKITEFGGEFGKSELEPIAFGLTALKIIIIMEEEKGSTDSLEESISTIKGVKSIEVVDARRAIG